jgi:hypothetical protein
MRSFQLRIGSEVAAFVHVDRPEALPEALAAVDLSGSRPVMVVVGGAGGLSSTELRRLSPVFTTGLAPAVEAAGAVAVDGGTDAGVMRLLGQARAASPRKFLLVGVAAAGTVRLPGEVPVREDAADLEPHHTHFVLVPGTEWGSEAPWISRTASELAGWSSSVTVLVNGGEIAYADAAHSLAVGRPVLVIDGSGRAANEIAAALRGASSDERAQAIAASHLVSSVGANDPAMVRKAVISALSSPKA